MFPTQDFSGDKKEVTRSHSMMTSPMTRGRHLPTSRTSSRWIRAHNRPPGKPPWSIATVSAGRQKSSDLVLSAPVRERFCDLLSMKLPRAQSDLFLVAMVSTMAAILEIPMEEIRANIALDKETKSVLSGGGGRLQPVYHLLLAQQAGKCQAAKESAGWLLISESEAGELWWRAMQWARPAEQRRRGWGPSALSTACA